MNWKRVSVASIAAIMLSACNSGSSTLSLSAAVLSGSGGTVFSVNGSSCTNMVTGSTCVIQLTFNNNNTPNVTLTYAPNPLPTPFINDASFNDSVKICQSAINSSSGVLTTCLITVVYDEPTPGAVNSQNASLVFTLSSPNASSAVANTITLSGN